MRLSLFSFETMGRMSQRDPFDQAVINAAIAERKDAEERKLRVIRRTLEYVMETPEGRKAMEVILDITNLHQPSFSTNALTMAFNEGKRSVGLTLLSLIDPISYQQLLKESHARRIDASGDRKSK